MFTAQELNMVSRKYFRIVDIETDVITLISKNTLHGWHLYRPITNCPNISGCYIFHRHENQIEYHLHAFANTFDGALCTIRQHDNYQINTRWKGRSYKKGKRKPHK